MSTATETKFLGYTIGLMATHFDVQTPKLVKVQFDQTDDGVRLTAVSGHTLGKFGGLDTVTITDEQYEGRPRGGVDLALWAFGQLGWEV